MLTETRNHWSKKMRLLMNLACLITVSACSGATDIARHDGSWSGLVSTIHNIARYGDLGDYKYTSKELGIDFALKDEKPVFRLGVKTNIISISYEAMSPSSYYGKFIDQSKVVYVLNRSRDQNPSFMQIPIRPDAECLTQERLTGAVGGEGWNERLSYEAHVRYDFISKRNDNVIVIYVFSKQTRCLEFINIDQNKLSE